MKKLVALLLAGIMLCCLVSCSPEAPAEDPVDDTPTVGDSEKQYSFMRKDNSGVFQPVSAVIFDKGEDFELTICYGYINDKGEAVPVPAVFSARNMLDEFGTIDNVTFEPYDDGTESCKVTVSVSGYGYPASIVCHLKEQEGDEPVKAIPIIPVGEAAQYVNHSDFRFFVKNSDGSYSAIDYISADNRLTVLTIAYGRIEDGNVKLYETRFRSRDFIEPTEFLTVSPDWRNTDDCVVAVNARLESCGAYVYCEPENVPGVMNACLPVVLNYSP